MSPQAGPKGSGPEGKITADDIRASAQELAGGVEKDIQATRPLMTYAAVGGALLLVLASFWLGRRSGRRKSTIVEIRRG